MHFQGQRSQKMNFQFWPIIQYKDRYWDGCFVGYYFSICTIYDAGQGHLSQGQGHKSHGQHIFIKTGWKSLCVWEKHKLKLSSSYKCSKMVSNHE